eukprot:9162874-Pyramimonas_sp.AAC.1
MHPSALADGTIDSLAQQGPVQTAASAAAPVGPPAAYWLDRRGEAAEVAPPKPVRVAPGNEGAKIGPQTHAAAVEQDNAGQACKTETEPREPRSLESPDWNEDSGAAAAAAKERSP